MAIVDGQVILASDFNIQSGGNDQITLESGVTLTTLSLCRSGQVVSMYLRVTLSSSIAAGNHADILIGTLATKWRPAHSVPALPTGWVAPEGSYITSGGGVYLAYNLSGSTITSGTSIDVGATWITNQE